MSNKTNAIHISIFGIECPQEDDYTVTVKGDPHAYIKLRARGQDGDANQLYTTLFFDEPDALLELANLLQAAATEMQEARAEEGDL